MPLREWAKKHIHKKGSREEKEEKGGLESGEGPPNLQVFRSDTLGITPIQIPETGSSHHKGLSTPSPILGSSPKSSKPGRLSLLGARHRSGSENSLPDWDPPDDSNPNAGRDWEVRATTLAKLRPSSMASSQEDLADLTKLSIKDDQSQVGLRTTRDDDLTTEGTSRSGPPKIIDGLSSEEALQEAIRLHEAGGIPIFQDVGTNYRTGEGHCAFPKDCRTACQ
jgi:hypothetical protein